MKRVLPLFLLLTCISVKSFSQIKGELKDNFYWAETYVLYEEYKEYIKSDIADLKNSGGRQGSLSSSACFLHEFAGDTPWVHLDIAGTAYIEKDKPYIPKGATGIGVRLLFNVINNFK